MDNTQPIAIVPFMVSIVNRLETRVWVQVAYLESDPRKQK